jgi:hypothetical protein
MGDDEDVGRIDLIARVGISVESVWIRGRQWCAGLRGYEAWRDDLFSIPLRHLPAGSGGPIRIEVLTR